MARYSPAKTGGCVNGLPTHHSSLRPDGGFDDTGRKVTLGSRVLFRESLAMGYRFSRRHSVSFYAAHMSNGGLADDNDGMNFVGIRYGYSLE